MAPFLSRLAAVTALAILVPGLALAQVGQSSAPYSGVTPQGGEPPTHVQPPPGFNFVTWPGFKVFSDGASAVFLQLTGPVTYQMKKRGRRVYVVMEKVQVPLRNNFRRVITRHFKDTPVSHFRLRKLKKDRIRLEITLKRGSTPTVALRSAGQYNYLVVNFPPAFSRSRAR